MNIRSLWTGAIVCSALLLGASWTGAEPQASALSEPTASGAEVPKLPVEQYVLANGLTVMLSQDRALPSVATQLVYLVGSGHEAEGRTGFAHLFEHLMFQGSQHFDHEYFAPFEPIGARTNGNTSSDRTVYYEQVPKQYAELSLWMESDRMRSLLPVLSQDKLDNQREVVKNERRQRYEITPYGMAFWHMNHALFPKGHPYHHSTIGSHEDLTAATLDDVKHFFETYYVPSNAGLVIVGDFEMSEMKSLIEKYFADIPPGKRAATPEAPAVQLAGQKHWVAQDNIQLPRVYFAWITPALFEEGDAELDLLSNVLSSGKTSRLFKSLVYDQKLAKDVYAYQISQKLYGVYVIQATAAPGTELDELASSLRTELEKSLDLMPTESEMLRARNDYKKGFYHRLETYSDRADLIGTYFLHTGKGDAIAQDFERYAQATKQEVLSAGKKYLRFDRSLRLDFVPGDKSAPVKKLELEAQDAAPAAGSQDTKNQEIQR